MRVEDFINQNRGKIVEVHWNETIQKYVKNLSLLEVLLNELRKEDYFNLSSNFFENINNDIRNYLENAINPSYQIAIVGAIKAGKSTLINTLIGDDLASVSVTPETATLTKFRYSEVDYVKIKFYTIKDWKEIWESANKRNAIKFLKEYKELGSETVKNSLLGKKEEYKEFTDISELKREVEKWTSSQSKEHYFVKEIEIGVNNLRLPKQVCLVDTPGLNDMVDYRSKITRDYIDSANAVLVCVNAKTLRNEEALTLARVFSKARYKKDKIYVLGTQIDTFNSLKDWEKQRKDWVKSLKETEYFNSEILAEKNILGISSQSYSIAKRKLYIDNISRLTIEEKKTLPFDELFEIKMENDQNEKIKKINELKEKLIKDSNIEKVKDIIKNQLLKDFNEDMLKDFNEKYRLLKEEINNFKEEHLKIISKAKKDFEKPYLELEEKIKKEKEKIEKLEKTNDRLKGKIREVGKAFNNDFKEMEKAFDELKERIDNVNIE